MSMESAPVATREDRGDRIGAEQARGPPQAGMAEGEFAEARPTMPWAPTARWPRRRAK